MTEQSFTQIGQAIEQANEAIIDQNNRLNLSDQIQDEEFKALALSGLREEQQQVFDQRQSATANVDFIAAGQQWAEDIEATEAIQSTTSEAQMSIEKIQAQADLAANISPGVAEAVSELAQSKIVAIQEQIATSQEDLYDISVRELGYTALFQPWVIPKVPGVIITGPSTPIDTFTHQLKALDEVDKSTPVEQAHSTDTSPEIVENGSLNYEELESVLPSVLWAVFDYASAHSGIGVRVEEMRRTVPELAQLSDQEYQYFKDQFANLRQAIVDKMKSTGVEVQWIVTGKTRGTRYHVVSDEKRDRQAASSSFFLPTSTIEYRGAQSEQSNADPTQQLDAATPEDTTSLADQMQRAQGLEDGVNPEVLRNIPLISSVISTIKNLQELNGRESQKRTYLARVIAGEIGLDVATSGWLLSKLVNNGLLYERGHQKSTRLLSTEPNPDEKSGIDTTEPTNNDSTTDRSVTKSESVPSDTSGATPEIDDDTQLVGIAKRDPGNGSGYTVADIPLDDVAKQFGYKNNHELSREITKWLVWLQDNPSAPTARKIKAFRGRKFHDHGTIPLLRFSPMDNPELSTDGRFRRYRIAYGVVNEKVVIFDILDHGKFDIKYK